MTSERLPFVDAHVHLWQLDRLRYPWLTPPFGEGPAGSVEAIAHDYTLDDYLAEAAAWNVVGIVHVDAGADPRDALAETDWLQDTADARGLPSGIVAFAALDDPHVETLLAAHAARGRVRGIRHIVNWHGDPARSYTPRDLTRDEAWRRGFAALARHALLFDLQAYPGQFAALAPFLAAHPDVPVIVNHLGMPVAGDADGWGEWRRGLAALAALDHVAIKLSGVGFIRRPWTVDDVRAPVLEAIDLFGTRRVLVASDFPTDRLFASMDATLGTYEAITAAFTDDERRDLWGRNADRIYRLGLTL